MSSLDQNIRGALQMAALAVPGFPAQANVAFENREFSSSPEVSWARLTVAPASSRPFGVNTTTTRHDGLFLVDLFFPANVGGTAAIDALAAAVRTAFKPATRLILDGVAVHIDYAERSRAMEQKPDWLMCAITIGWHCFSSLN